VYGFVNKHKCERPWCDLGPLPGERLTSCGLHHQSRVLSGWASAPQRGEAHSLATPFMLSRLHAIKISYAVSAAVGKSRRLDGSPSAEQRELCARRLLTSGSSEQPPCQLTSEMRHSTAFARGSG
jgi:hypothetical protein